MAATKCDDNGDVPQQTPLHIAPSLSCLTLYNLYDLQRCYMILGQIPQTGSNVYRAKYRILIIVKQQTKRELDIREMGEWWDGYEIVSALREICKEWNNGRGIEWDNMGRDREGGDIRGKYKERDIRDADGAKDKSYNDAYASSSGRRRAPQLTSSQPPITSSYGIVGLVRFLDCYYLTLITKRVCVGNIGGCDIWTVRGTESRPLRGCVKGEIKRQDDMDDSTVEETEGGIEGMSKASDGTMETKNSASSKSYISQIWSKGKRSMGLGLTNREIAELRYQGLWGFTDLAKGFYFSYSYDLTRSLQSNMISSSISPFPPAPYKTMYAWNHAQTRLFESACGNASSNWVLPLVHGSYIQRAVEVGGRNVNLIVIARRSRHFAGTRYLKRGVSDAGKTANDVEHEQIVVDDIGGGRGGVGSGFVQVRGSIPTYWAQETSGMTPKPPILLNRVDPTYKATRMHFSDLMSRYGGPIVVLDLVKQSEKREREVIVGNEYRHAIEYLNSTIDNPEHKIRYCALDYSHVSKHRNFNVSKALDEAAVWAVNMSGFFVSNPKNRIDENGVVRDFWRNKQGKAKSGPPSLRYHLGVPIAPMEQHGVLRTNCIDCLDRTNVAQFSAGVCALGQQLLVMGVTGTLELEQGQAVVTTLMDMYSEIGDQLAMQYGGSEAHKKVASQGNSFTSVQGPTMGKHKEFLTSIRRYYSNTFTDRLKQDAMNLFLGNFVPQEGGTPLWEMENDYYLHNFHVQQGANERDMQFAQDLGVTVGDNEDRGEEDDEDDRNEKSKKHRNVIARGLHKVKKRAARSTSPKGRAKPPTPTTTSEKSMVALIKARAAERARVKKRCIVQKTLLSSWWKEALQSYLQSRMWMQLSSPSEAVLLPPFDRLYTPSKLTEFDEYFSHSWATPSRKTSLVVRNKSPMFGMHTAIASGISVIGAVGATPGLRSSPSSDDQGTVVTTSDMSPSPAKSSPPTNIKPPAILEESIPPEHLQHPPRNLSGSSIHPAPNVTPNNAPINYYMRKIGTKAIGTAKSILYLPLKSSSFSPSSSRSISSSRGLTDSKQQGDHEESKWELENQEDIKDYEEFVAYAENPSLLAESFNPASFTEFTESLTEVTLNSDDVEGILKLSKSAHITSEITSGPYEGLLQDTSAIGVSTLVHSQLEVLASAAERGDEEDGKKQMMANLQKNGIEATCMKDLIEQKWEELKDSKGINKEILEDGNLKSMRSELTTDEGLSLYCRYYDEESILGDKELKYMMSAGAEADFLASNSTPPPPPGSTGGSSLTSGRKGHVKDGFEQINDDLFARRANKFMVFNGVGMEEWTTKPLTKMADDEAFVKKLFGVKGEKEGEL